MRVLPVVNLTGEQLKISKDDAPGQLLIRGAAGSGKTTAAMSRLGQVCGSWSQETLLGDQSVRALVLTFNRTLIGYIKELIQRSQVLSGVDVSGYTFATWAKRELDISVESPKCDSLLWRRAETFPMDQGFLLDEVNYVLNRFEPHKLADYVTTRRDGRGRTPRVDTNLRQRILDEVIYPYQHDKRKHGVRDWNDQAVAASRAPVDKPWNIVVVDEAQDFSANQIRAINRHLAPRHSVTYIMDDTQRIYPGFFTWKEAGVELNKTTNLSVNYRNTKQIARFAKSIVDGIPAERDGAPPNSAACSREGKEPRVLAADSNGQVDIAMIHLRRIVEGGEGESVAFLFPKKNQPAVLYLRERLRSAGIAWSELTRKAEWPVGEKQVAISTIHSAKGLEFDHVKILGLDAETMFGSGEDRDDLLETQRRLLAMGAGRARQTVTIGFDPEKRPLIADYFREGAYRLVEP